MSYSENTLVEQPAIALFAELGWRTVSAMEEVFGKCALIPHDVIAENMTLNGLAQQYGIQ